VVSLVSSINKIDRHDIAEILLKVALNTKTLTLTMSIPDEGYYKMPFIKYLRFFLPNKIFTISVPDEGYSKNTLN
jgi:hypothetical protein